MTTRRDLFGLMAAALAALRFRPGYGSPPKAVWALEMNENRFITGFIRQTGVLLRTERIELQPPVALETYQAHEMVRKRLEELNG